jgi:hypothetical protein
MDPDIEDGNFWLIQMLEPSIEASGSNCGIDHREMSGIPSPRGNATVRDFVQAIRDQID